MWSTAATGGNGTHWVPLKHPERKLVCCRTLFLSPLVKEKETFGKNSFRCLIWSQYMHQFMGVCLFFVEDLISLSFHHLVFFYICEMCESFLHVFSPTPFHFLSFFFWVIDGVSYILSLLFFQISIKSCMHQMWSDMSDEVS